jgi:hypothetical protein
VRRPVLEVSVEERLQDLAAEILRRVAAEADRADGAAVAPLLVVEPRAQHEMDVSGRIARLDRLPHRHGAVNVLLVPQAVDEEGRHGDRRLLEEELVDRLLLPEGIVSGMLGSFAPPR